jgi:hypothetical protein
MNTSMNNNIRNLPPSGSDVPIDPSIVDAMANQVLAALKNGVAASSNGATSKAIAAPPTAASSDSAWLSFSKGLDDLAKSSPQLVTALTSSLVKSARQALAGTDAAVPSTDDFVKGISVTSKGNVQAYWWGFQIYLSHQDLQSFVPGATAVNAVVAVVGGLVAGPWSPWIAAAAAFITAALNLLKGMDTGSGVFVSMSWFAPGAFVPTQA